jgi:RHS repeat-associated protein
VNISTATNQITSSGYVYDAAGNMTYDGSHSYTYDAEGNILTVYNCNTGTPATYVYNALNQRVRTVVGSTTTEFVFDASGERVSEWNAATHAQLQGNYYWKGKPLAYYTTAADTTAKAGIHFEHQNYLGTERMRTMPTGPYNSSNPQYAVEATFAEQPFGDNKKTFPGTVIETSFDTDANHYAFLDSDKETATDHADFRQYSNAQGRWMAPDPYDGSYNPYNPQSLNRYVYADNSPFSYTDGDGELDENGGDSGCELDGTDQDCSLVYSLLAMGAAKECPSDVCHGRTYSGASYDYDCIGNVCNYYLSGLTTSEIINALNQECGGGKGEAPNSAMCKAPNNWVQQLFQIILDKIADKAIPASPWKPDSRIANCIQQFGSNIGPAIGTPTDNGGKDAFNKFVKCWQGVPGSLSPIPITLQ